MRRRREINRPAWAPRRTRCAPPTPPQKSFWALGGDANGAMYGGLQLAENLRFDQFSGAYALQESPARGFRTAPRLMRIDPTL